MAIEDHVDIDTSGYSPVTPPPSSASQVDQPLLPTRDSKLRFSAPNIPGAFPSSDTLIGYHLGGQIPQYRIPVPPQTNNSAVVTPSGITAISSSSSSTTNNPPVAKSASVTTSALSPGGQFTGTTTLAKAYIVLSVAVNTACRVRLYSTLMAQSTDLSRPITQGPGFGTEQGIVGDMVLDTAPVVWFAENMTGTNSDSPQTTVAYITCDNLSAATQAITISIVFVPLQS